MKNNEIIINNKREANLVKLALYSLGNVGKYYRDIERNLYNIRSFNLTSSKPFDNVLKYIQTRKSDVYDTRNIILDRLEPVSVDVYFQRNTLKYTNLDNPDEFRKHKCNAIKKFMFSDWGKNYRGIIVPDENDSIAYAIYFVNYEIDGMKFTRRVSEDEFNENYNHLPVNNHDLSEDLPFGEFDDEFNDYISLDVIVDLLNRQPSEILDYHLLCADEDFESEDGDSSDIYNILISRREKNFLFSIESSNETYEHISYDEEGYEEYLEFEINSIETMVEELNSLGYYSDVILEQGYENNISVEQLEIYFEGEE